MPRMSCKGNFYDSAESGLINAVTASAANEHYNTRADDLLHDVEALVFADYGYRGITKREEIQYITLRWTIKLT